MASAALQALGQRLQLGHPHVIFADEVAVLGGHVGLAVDLGLFGEVTLALGAAASGALVLCGTATGAFGFLLLSPRQLLELFHGLVELMRLFLPFTALHGFVLVLELVQLEFEEVGEVVGIRSATPAARLLSAGRDVPLVGFFGLLEPLKRPLLGGQRFPRAFFTQQFLCRLHLPDGLGEHPGDPLELLLGLRDPAVHHPLVERLDLFTHPALRELHADDGLRVVVVGVELPVPLDVEGRRDHISL